MNTVLNFLKLVFMWVYKLLNSNSTPDYVPKNKPEPEDTANEQPTAQEGFPQNPDAIAQAIKFLDKNQAAYYAGKQIWPSGKINNKVYNNILLLCQPEYLKVYRLYQDGIQKYIDYEQSSEKEYNSIPHDYWITYCNLALSVFYTYFVNDPNGTLSRYQTESFDNKGNSIGMEWHQYDANKVCQNIFDGLYKCDGHTFIECDLSQANRIASQGGLVVCVFKNPVGWGHVGTIIDGQGTVYQAGKDFGKMDLNQAFGAYVAKVRFFYWGKRT